MHATRKRTLVSVALAVVLVASVVLIPLASADNRGEDRTANDAPSAGYTETILDGTVQPPADGGGDAGREGAGSENSEPNDAALDAQEKSPEAPSGGDSADADENDIGEQAEASDGIEAPLAGSPSDGSTGSDGGSSIVPLADTTLRVNVSDDPLSWVNLESTLKRLYSEEDIAAATVLEIEGSQIKFQLGGYENTNSINYLNTLGITTIDLSRFTGDFYAYALSGAKKITTVALGKNIPTIPMSAFSGCSSLTTVGDTLDNLTSGIVDLSATGVTSFSNQWEFSGCSSITTVVLGPDITVVGYEAFARCTSLTTLAGSLAEAQANPGIIDFSSTEVTTLGASMFSGCAGITHIVLGTGIETLPGGVFRNLKALSAVSDTVENVRANPKVVDLEKTGVDVLDAAGAQFEGNETFDTVTLGKAIDALPTGVFGGCKALWTVSDTLDNARTYPRVVDLDKTGITSLGVQGWQFANNPSIGIVTLGKDPIALPPYAFTGCYSLQTVTDTIENARGSSNGFLDFEKLPSMELDARGWQFNGAVGSIAYIGADDVVLPTYSLGDMRAFVPETTREVTLTGKLKAYKLYVRGPENTSPTKVVNPEHQVITHYLATSFSSSGWSMVQKKTNEYDPYLIDNINRKAISEGLLESGHEFVEEGVELKYSVFTLNDEKLKEITYNGVPIEPISIENGVYTLPAPTEDTDIHFEFVAEFNIIHAHRDRTGSVVAGVSDAWYKGYQGEAYTGSPADIPGFVYQGFELQNPNGGNPSLVDDKAVPHLEKVLGNTYLYLIYGRDAGGGEDPGIGGGGTTPDGVEDIDVVRHWGTISNGAFSEFSEAMPDTQIVNIGNEFSLGYADASQAAIPTGYAYKGYLTDQDEAGVTPHTGAPAFTASVSGGNREVYYIFEQASYAVAEHHVNRTGESLVGDTEETVVHGASYSGASVQPIVGKVFVGAEYSKPSSENRSTVSDGAVPVLASVEADAEVWYVYGNDNGGGGGLVPDGFEDFSFVREWATLDSLGAPVRLPSTSSDTRYVNVGDSFVLAHDDAPAPAIAPGYAYLGYLTDQDASGTFPHAGVPDLTANIEDGNRTVSYIYAEPMEEPALDTPLETDTAITGSADRDNAVSVTFANGQTVSTTASSAAPLVADTGYWTVEVPAGVILTRGDTVSVVQIDALGRTSPVATTAVLPVDHAVSISYADDAGRPISGGGTSSIAHRQPFSYAPPAVHGYSYSGWSLNGAHQGSGNPNIPSVTGSHAVTLVYAANGGSNPDPNPGPGPKPGTDEGNYDFVKAPNVKSVKPGETVSYTFTGFGNGWGVSLDKYAITDKPDKGLDFVSASLPAFTGAQGVRYDVVYYTNHSGRTVLHAGVDAAKAFSFSAPTLASGEYLTGLVIDFGTVPAGFGQNDRITMQFKVWDNPPSKTLNNVGMLSYWNDGEGFEFSSGKSGSVVLGGYFSDLVRTGDGPIIALTLAGAGAMAVIAIVLASLVVRRRRTQRASG